LLLRVGRLHVAHLGDVGMAVEGVVVHRELRVERLHLAGRGDDQRVDLAEHRVAGDERLVQPSDQGDDLLLLGRVVDASAEAEPARLVGLEPDERVDVEPGESLRARLRDLLDVDAALGRQHEERLLLSAVERDREVVLLRDLRGLLDPEPPDDVTTDVEAEDLPGPRLGVVGILGELDPTSLPAPAGEHLSLDDDLAAELLRSRARLCRRRHETAFGHGNAEAREELLSLVFVEIHGRRRV
jgi:hypothetical protein